MDIPEIDFDELAARLERGDGVLIDVRRPEEWDEAHLEGATLVTLDTLPDRLDELPAAEPILVICRSGARSAAATQALVGAGFDATNVAGGMLAWIDSGRGVVRSEG